MKSQERSSEMSLRSREPFIYKLSNSRQIKRCREVSSFKGFDKCSYRAGVQGKKNLDGSRICWGAAERTKSFSIDQPSYRQVSKSCRDCLKQFFKEEKNTNMNAIKHATQPRIQTTFWTLKIISQQKNVKHIDPKTHTHTHKTSLINFIFKK